MIAIKPLGSISKQERAQFRLSRNIVDLSGLIRINPDLLEKIVINPEYHEFPLRKRKGGFRKICSPSRPLKDVQLRLYVYLGNIYEGYAPLCVHGFIKNRDGNNRNILSNASVHLQKPFVLNMDIADFFPGISADMVREALLTFPGAGFSLEAASIISLLATYNWTLPAGSPLSPVISNIVFYKADLALEAYASTNDLTYTRYADDLSFSGEVPVTETHIQEIRRILEAHQFRVNTKKQRIQGQYGPQWVTGIKVNQKPNIDRRDIRNLRATLHYWETAGLEAAQERFKAQKLKKPGDNSPVKFIRSVAGKIAFMAMVRKRDYEGEKDPVTDKLITHFKWLVKRDCDYYLNKF